MAYLSAQEMHNQGVADRNAFEQSLSSPMAQQVASQLVDGFVMTMLKLTHAGVLTPEDNTRITDYMAQQNHKAFATLAELAKLSPEEQEAARADRMAFLKAKAEEQQAQEQKAPMVLVPDSGKVH